jgi:DNA-binding CsgD family transcriptional regulator
MSNSTREAESIMSVSLLTPAYGHPEASSRSPSRSTAIDQRRRRRRADDIKHGLLASISVALLERDAQPCIVADERMNVLAMNDQARRILREMRSLTIGGMRLKMLTRKAALQWARVVSGEIVTTVCRMRAEERMEVVSLARLGSTPCILIRLRQDSAEDRLRRTYGLTQAESDVARGISQGLSLVKIARARNASINTVKTQVRNIFHKVGVRSQVLLTRRITELDIRRAPRRHSAHP